MPPWQQDSKTARQKTMEKMKGYKILVVDDSPELLNITTRALKKAGYLVSSLGPLVLRGETAAIVATYLAVHGV